MIADASLAAHSQIKPTVGPQCARVMTMLKRWKRGRTNAELALVLKMEKSTVAARINGLKKVGLVEESKQRRCQVTGFTAKVHQVVTS